MAAGCLSLKDPEGRTRRVRTLRRSTTDRTLPQSLLYSRAHTQNMNTNTAPGCYVCNDAKTKGQRKIKCLRTSRESEPPTRHLPPYEQINGFIQLVLTLPTF